MDRPCQQLSRHFETQPSWTTSHKNCAPSQHSEAGIKWISVLMNFFLLLSALNWLSKLPLVQQGSQAQKSILYSRTPVTKLHLSRDKFKPLFTLQPVKSSDIICERGFCKGRGPKKKPYFLMSFAKPGGGSARAVKKPYCFFEKSIFSESMQNHSRTPKTCFTLGLECICQVYS